MALRAVIRHIGGVLVRMSNTGSLACGGQRLGVPPEACEFVDGSAPNVVGAADVGMVGIRFESAAQIEAALRQTLQ